MDAFRRVFIGIVVGDPVPVAEGILGAHLEPAGADRGPAERHPAQLGIARLAEREQERQLEVERAAAMVREQSDRVAICEAIERAGSMNCVEMKNLS